MNKDKTKISNVFKSEDIENLDKIENAENVEIQNNEVNELTKDILLDKKLRRNVSESHLLHDNIKTNIKNIDSMLDFLRFFVSQYHSFLNDIQLFANALILIEDLLYKIVDTNNKQFNSLHDYLKYIIKYKKQSNLDIKSINYDYNIPIIIIILDHFYRIKLPRFIAENIKYDSEIKHIFTKINNLLLDLYISIFKKYLGKNEYIELLYKHAKTDTLLDNREMFITHCLAYLPTKNGLTEQQLQPLTSYKYVVNKLDGINIASILSLMLMPIKIISKDTDLFDCIQNAYKQLDPKIIANLEYYSEFKSPFDLRFLTKYSLNESLLSYYNPELYDYCKKKGFCKLSLSDVNTKKYNMNKNIPNISKRIDYKSPLPNINCDYIQENNTDKIDIVSKIENSSFSIEDTLKDIIESKNDQKDYSKDNYKDDLYSLYANNKHKSKIIENNLYYVLSKISGKKFEINAIQPTNLINPKGNLINNGLSLESINILDYKKMICMAIWYINNIINTLIHYKKYKNKSYEAILQHAKHIFKVMTSCINKYNQLHKYDSK